MSHYTTLVIMPDGFCEEKLNALLAPYDERIEVPEYDHKCYCVGSIAQNRASELMQKQMGTWEEVKESFRRKYPRTNDTPYNAFDAEWQREVFTPRHALESQLLGEMEDKYAPNPECPECHGTGFYRSQYNPKSKWDWWTIGGRWTGSLGTYRPEMDKANYVKCYMCNGTGSRPDGDYSKSNTWARKGNDLYPVKPNARGCNVCYGSGMNLKWSSEFKNVDNVMVVSQINPHFTPYSLITPDGEWHEKGHMGWFGISSNEDDNWPERYKMLIARYQANTAVLCDLHI